MATVAQASQLATERQAPQAPQSITPAPGPLAPPGLVSPLPPGVVVPKVWGGAYRLTGGSGIPPREWLYGRHLIRSFVSATTVVSLCPAAALRLWCTRSTAQLHSFAILAHVFTTASMALLPFSLTAWLDTNGSTWITSTLCVRAYSMTASMTGSRMRTPSRVSTAALISSSRPLSRWKRSSMKSPVML